MRLKNGAIRTTTDVPTCKSVQYIQEAMHATLKLLSGKVVAFHQDDSTVKTYLCNQGDIVSVVSFQTRL